MKKKVNNYLLIYLLVLLFFSYFFLFIKHQVGNDSTISEWLINYEGGFTKRGIIGQIAIEITRIFNIELRQTIFLLQSLSCTLYFYLLFKFLRDFELKRILSLSIFTPIFILYPIAEIEVLARKEIIIFSLFLLYLFIPKINNLIRSFSLIIFTLLSILIWEPIIFFFPLLLFFEIVERRIKKFDLDFLKIILSFVPSLIIASVFVFNPLTLNEHEAMAEILKNEFGEKCYMSCGLLKTKSTILQQFQGNLGKYTFEIIIRYIIIIILGFLPLLILFKYSSLKNKNLLFFKSLKNELSIFYISLLPVILLFAMGYDWGRWVNISYVMLFLTYMSLLSKKELILDNEKLEKNFFNRIKKSFFIVIFIFYCFGWNPKTVMTGDIASFPGYRIPYKIFKITLN